jgi:hypothetical protein
MPARRYSCETVYSGSVISDINPLLLEAYPRAKILVMCAREQQMVRLENLLKTREDLASRLVLCGWWEARKKDLFNSDGLLDRKVIDIYDIVVLLTPGRIDGAFSHLVQQVTDYVKYLTYSPLSYRKV